LLEPPGRFIYELLRQAATPIAIGELRKRNRFVLTLPFRPKRLVNHTSPQYALISIVQVPCEICRFLSTIRKGKNLFRIFVALVKQRRRDDRVGTVATVYNFAHGIMTSVSTRSAPSHLIQIFIGTLLFLYDHPCFVIATGRRSGRRQGRTMNTKREATALRSGFFILVILASW
jgi:hypothetical protein